MMSSGNFQIRECPLAEHRIILVDGEYVFKHADDSECERMRLLEWYEVKDPNWEEC